MRELVGGFGKKKTGKPNNSAEPANEFKATAVLPYVKGLSEQLRRCLQQQGVRAVFIVLYKITHDQSASSPEED